MIMLSELGSPARVKVSVPVRGRQPHNDEDFWIAVVAKAKSPKDAQVIADRLNAHWKQDGRGGSADSLLGSLVKDGTLKRKSLGGRMGSEYSLTSGRTAAAPQPRAGRKRRGRGSYGTTAVPEQCDGGEPDQSQPQQARGHDQQGEGLLQREQGHGADGPQAHGQLKEPRRLDEAFRRCGPAGNLEAQRYCLDTSLIIRQSCRKLKRNEIQ